MTTLAPLKYQTSVAKPNIGAQSAPTAVNRFIELYSERAAESSAMTKRVELWLKGLLAAISRAAQIADSKSTDFCSATNLEWHA